MDDEKDYLAHYGVLGMKWGVRNAETLRKYAGEKGRTLKNRTKTNMERTRASRNRSQLSDAELDRRIARLEKEKKLRQLTESEVAPGRAYVKDFLKDNGKKIASGLVVGLGSYAVSRYLGNKKYGSVPRDFIGPVQQDPWDWGEAAKLVSLQFKKKK